MRLLKLAEGALSFRPRYPIHGARVIAALGQLSLHLPSSFGQTFVEFVNQGQGGPPRVSGIGQIEQLTQARLEIFVDRGVDQGGAAQANGMVDKVVGFIDPKIEPPILFGLAQ